MEVIWREHQRHLFAISDVLCIATWCPSALKHLPLWNTILVKVQISRQLVVWLKSDRVHRVGIFFPRIFLGIFSVVSSLPFILYYYNWMAWYSSLSLIACVPMFIFHIPLVACMPKVSDAWSSGILPISKVNFWLKISKLLELEDCAVSSHLLLRNK